MERGITFQQGMTVYIWGGRWTNGTQHFSHPFQLHGTYSQSNDYHSEEATKQNKKKGGGIVG